MTNGNVLENKESDALSVKKNHLRVAIPLFFIQYHLHLALIRDRSEVRSAKEKARRLLGKLIGKAFLGYLAFCIFLPFIFFGLYLIKSWMGIDIFSEYHLSDFLPFLK